jgi:hypothetical protein
LVFIGLLFIPAGTARWFAGWLFVALFWGFVLLVVRMMLRNNPQLLEERMSSLIQGDQPLWDRVLLPVFMLLFIAWLTLMPLDAVRFGWSDAPAGYRPWGLWGSCSRSTSGT